MMGNKPWRVVAALVVALTVMVGVANQRVRASDDQAGPRQLRVVWEQDPAHHARISWTTSAAGAQHTVYYDTAPRQGDLGAYNAQVSAAATGHYGEDAALPTYHHAELEGLAPSTRYYFVVESDGVALEERWFETAPADDRRVKLLYGGDSRSDWEDRRRMNQRMAALLEQDPEIVALWHGGDFVDEGDDWDDWTAWLDDHPLTTTPQGRVLPVIPTRGNHERSGRMYNEVFGTPGPDEVRNYFVTQLGEHASLLTLDSQASVRGEQRTWLERQLIELQQRRWILAGYHTPAWPAVKIAGPVYYSWVELFERYRVDLVCENDGHALKRTVPILADAEHPDGVVYVGEGGLGVKQRDPDEERWYLKGGGMTRSAHHVQRLTIEPGRLGYEAIGIDGQILDTWERAPRAMRMIGPFELEDIEQEREDRIVLHFTHGVAPEEMGPEDLSLSPAVPIEKLYTNYSGSELKVSFTEPLQPGTEYTVDLSGVRDVSGRALPEGAQQASFTSEGDPPPRIAE